MELAKAASIGRSKALVIAHAIPSGRTLSVKPTTVGLSLILKHLAAWLF